MLNEQVRKIMEKKPTVVSPTNTIKEVTDLMEKKRMQQLPVVDDDNKLVGIVTSYDMWKSLKKSKENESKSIKSIMSKKVLKIAPKDKVGTAAELFIDKRFKTIPVVNLNNELKGVLTAFDVIRHVHDKEYPKKD